MNTSAGRKLLVNLTSVTGFLRKAVILNRRSHIADISQFTSLTSDYIVALLANALKSDYRDEQLELFCSQIIFCSYPTDLQVEQYPVSRTVQYPPLDILAALSGSDRQILEDQHNTPEGREILAKYIELKWVPEQKEWTALLDRNLKDSALLTKMEELFPTLDYSKLLMFGVQGPRG
jgi:hypothetical protein